MSKGNTFENDLLALIFNATPIGNIADNAASAPLTQLFVSLHTADPGEAGSQTTSECNYTGYARIGVNRNSGGWTVTGNSVSPAANIDFANPTNATNLPQTATNFAIGTASTGTGKVLYKGALSPTIVISNTGVTPRITTGTTITED
ncbi:hypothetical protein C7451_106158 [Blastomonas natatoria]|uniref:Uncharacterized protein n=1 Tax=Blastomonas natatoria TaxID=34015 RepID=A0A2V3V4G2_9SPHN|nr:hypothetical protein [Blastomonas natatoria]PXW75994.1 hypothetical protein C7451_106158 [Blastomonas natatoria]